MACFRDGIAGGILAPSKQQAVGETSYEHRMTRCTWRSCAALSIAYTESFLCNGRCIRDAVPT